MRPDRERLLDIMDAIDQALRRTSRVQEDFLKDEMVQIWAIHHLQIIGEAAARLSPELRAKYPDVPWMDIISMRNVVVHHYFGIDWREVWRTVIEDLPVLRTTVAAMLGPQEQEAP